MEILCHSLVQRGNLTLSDSESYVQTSKWSRDLFYIAKPRTAMHIPINQALVMTGIPALGDCD